MLLALLVCLAVAFWLQQRWQSSALDGMRAKVDSAKAQLANRTNASSSRDLAEPLSPAEDANNAFDPAAWPAPTEALDGWVREAAQGAARGNGVVLQQLSVTYPGSSERAGSDRSDAPYLTLVISARGPYSGLKQWQSEIQELLPSLSVESMSWQAPPNDGSGLLLAQWTWRLWTRVQGTATVGVGHRGAPHPSRPELLSAARDPFSLPIKVQPVTAVAPKPAPVLVTPVVPVEPPLQWTTLGRLQGPDGKNRVTGHWGTRANDVVTVAEGDMSPSGHKVVRITAAKMELQHPETQARLSFNLPPLPRFERR